MDQRRHAAPVDHAGGRGHAVSAGRQRRRTSRTCPIPGTGRDDVLLHEPAERAADVLPRPCVGHHAAQRLRGRGRRLPHHRRDGGAAHRRGSCPSDSSRSSSRTRRSCRARRSSPPGPDLGRGPLGRSRAASGSRTSTRRRRTPATAPASTSSAAGPTARGSGRPRRTSTTRPIANPYFDPSCDPARDLVRAAAHPGRPLPVDGHGVLQRHAGRERHGLPDRDGRPQVLSAARPERGQRPVLQPVSSTRPTPPAPRSR